MPELYSVDNARLLKNYVDGILDSLKTSPLNPLAKDKTQFVFLNSKSNLEELSRILSQPNEKALDDFIVSRFEILQAIREVLRYSPSEPTLSELNNYLNAAIEQQKTILLDPDKLKTAAYIKNDLVQLVTGAQLEPRNIGVDKQAMLSDVKQAMLAYMNNVNKEGEVDVKLARSLMKLKKILTKNTTNKTEEFIFGKELMVGSTFSAFEAQIGGDLKDKIGWGSKNFGNFRGAALRKNLNTESKEKLDSLNSSISTKKGFWYAFNKFAIDRYSAYYKDSIDLKYHSIDKLMAARFSELKKSRESAGKNLTTEYMNRQAYAYIPIYIMAVLKQIVLVPLVSALMLFITLPLSVIQAVLGKENPFNTFFINTEILGNSLLSMPLIVVKALFQSPVYFREVLYKIKIFGVSGYDKVYIPSPVSQLKNLSKFTRHARLYLNVFPEAVAQDPVLQFFKHAYDKNKFQPGVLLKVRDIFPKGISDALNAYVYSAYANMEGRRNIFYVNEPAFVGNISALAVAVRQQIADGESLTPGQKKMLVQISDILNENFKKLGAPLIDYTNIEAIPTFDPANFKHLEVKVIADLNLLRQGDGIFASPIQTIARRIDEANKAGKDVIPGYIVEYHRSLGEKIYNTIAFTDVKNILGFKRTNKDSYRPTSVHVGMGDYLIKDKAGALLGKIEFNRHEDIIALKMIVPDNIQQLQLITSYLKFVSAMMGDSLMPVVTIENLSTENELKIEDFLSDYDLQVDIKYKGDIDTSYFGIVPPPPSSPKKN